MSISTHFGTPHQWAHTHFGAVSLGDKLAMRALQHIRRGLRVAQQLVGRFAGVGLALA